jgi:hypothetical protein
MNVTRKHNRPGKWIHSLRLAAVAAGLWMFSAMPAMAQGTQDEADNILKQMSAYLGQVQNLTMNFSSDVEVISHGGQTSLSGLKVQFSSSGSVLLSRPDKIRASRTGGQTDFEVISDGKTLTIHGKDANAYAQADAAPTLDELFDGIRDLTGLEFPGADLLFSDVYGQLSEPIEQAAYLGTGIVDGQECHHLVFRTPDVDWQIWIETGDKPIPRKYVITSKWITGAPQYQLRISDWNDNPTVAADAFSFSPADGTESVDIEELEGLGEELLPAAVGGQ